MQGAPSVRGPTLNVDIAGPSICCHKSIEQLAEAVLATVRDAAEVYIREHRGPRLPVIMLHLHAPQLLFALIPDRCAVCCTDRRIWLHEWLACVSLRLLIRDCASGSLRPRVALSISNQRRHCMLLCIQRSIDAAASCVAWST